MSNKLINSMIALIEDRPEDARRILRSPELKGISIGEVQSRLYSAVGTVQDKAVASACRKILHQSLRLDPAANGKCTTPEQMEAYLEGVAAVESLLEAVIDDTQS